MSWDRSATSVVPVYLSSWQDQNIDRIITPGSSLTRNAIIWYTRAALDAWYEDGQAAIRFVHYGDWNQPDDTSSYPKVVIRALTDDDSHDCNGQYACSLMSECSGSKCKVATIWIRDAASMPSGAQWGVVPPGTSSSTFKDYMGALVHELGHILGLAHSFSCGNTVSVMDACGPDCHGRGNFRYLKRDDVNGVLAGYGWRNTETNWVAAADGLSWTAGLPVIPNYVPDARAGSVTTDHLSDNRIFVGFPYNHVAKVATYLSNAWSAGLSVIDAGSTGTTYNPVTMTMDRGSPVLVVAAWLSGETTTSDSRKIRWAKSWDDGSSWTYGYLQSSGQDITTTRNGVSGTWDPASAKWIFAWLDEANHVALTVFDGYNATSGNTIDTGIVAIDAPGVACSSESSMLPNNCIVTVPMSHTDGPLLAHFVGRVSSSTFRVTSSLYPAGAIQSQTPYVSAHGGSYPFVVTFRQGGDLNLNSFSYRRGPSPGAPWQDQRSFGVSPEGMGPSIGYREVSGYGQYYDVYVRSFD